MAFNYSYVPDSDLVAGYTNDVGLSVERTYEPNRNLISTIQNDFSGSLVSQFDYENDAIGRRTLRVDTLSTTNVFGYNLRSELTEATMGTNIYSYAYDAIGNRKTADHGLQTTTYLVNELNQYTNILEGAASSAPEYDADGNMISCGAWTFGWDAENRLIAVYSNETAVLQNAYDYMSRRVKKATVTTTNLFVYDGWNMIRELTTDNQQQTTNSYIWGLDLSGTLQGAGGIGGLLSVVHGPWSAGYVYDANGNVTDMVDTNGTVVAHYEYDPYGNEISRGGAEAQSNPYRFSTKYTDDETGLVYYGFRFYSPQLGRWISRDPIENLLSSRNAVLGIAIRYQLDWEGSVYAFVEENPLNFADFLGLCLIYYTCTLTSQSDSGSCDRNCNYDCKETSRRDLPYGPGTPCWEVPSPYDFSTTRVAIGFKVYSICCRRGSCAGTFTSVGNVGGIGGLDCSKSTCLNNCDKGYTAAKLACRLLSPPQRYVCMTAALTAKRACDFGCALCDKP